MSAWVLALALLALVFIQHFILVKLGLRGLKYSRHFSRTTAFEGETVEMIEELRNHRLLFIPWLRTESRISPYLRFGSMDNLDISGDRYHQSIFYLRPFQQITRRHQVHLTHRGDFHCNTISLTIGDLIGIANSEQKKVDVELLVYPRLLDTQVPLPVSRLLGEMIVPRHFQSDPFLVNGIRPYQPGDQRRDVHWPATARTGQLQVKTHDYTVDSTLLVVINSQMTELQWGNLMEYEQGLIEQAISLAATVCVRAMRSGIPAGFATNMPMTDSKESTFFLPQWNRGREEELLRAFARLKVLTSKSFLTFLEELYTLHDTDILILTPYDSELIEERLAMLRQRGNKVTVYIMEESA